MSTVVLFVVCFLIYIILIHLDPKTLIRMFQEWDHNLPRSIGLTTVTVSNCCIKLEIILSFGKTRRMKPIASICFNNNPMRCSCSPPFLKSFFISVVYCKLCKKRTSFLMFINGLIWFQSLNFFQIWNEVVGKGRFEEEVWVFLKFI